MWSPAVAMTWELWARNRGGIAALALAIGVLSAAGVMLPAGALREPVFPLSVVLFAVGCLLLASMVTRGDDRERGVSAGYSPRMFTLPVSSRMLAFWPMAFAGVALFALWTALAVLVWWPAGIEPAWWLPPLLVVALAWFQAVCWAVPGSRLTKVLGACMVLPVVKAMLELVATAVVLARDPHSPLDRDAFIEHRMVIVPLFCAAFLPLAYLVGAWGVARDRQGSGWPWVGLGGWSAWLRRAWPQRAAASRPFSSPAQALGQVEWRTRGLLLPLFPAGFLLFVTIVVAPFVSTPPLLRLVGFLGLALPVVAFFVGYGLGKRAFWSEDLGLPTWQATLPVSSPALAQARLDTAARSATAAVAVLVLGVPLWLIGLGRGGEALAVLRPYCESLSGPEVCGLAAAAVVALWGLTWGQMTGGLVLSLTGRVWVVNTAVALYAGVFFLAARLATTGFSVPGTDLGGVLGGLAALKMIVTVGLVLVLGRVGLLSVRNVLAACGLWLTAIGCLSTVLSWSVSILEIGPPATAWLLVPLSMLSVPLNRPLAAPLAVAWNRHR